jgi:hypothetical protein
VKKLSAAARTLNIPGVPLGATAALPDPLPARGSCQRVVTALPPIETHLITRDGGEPLCGPIRRVDPKGKPGKVCQACLVEAGRRRLEVR